ncbi:MAG: hypothetical protein HY042_00675, partial [Spirochaetia bacterium]|nr:hypothetical protein [Spirochaetia bacterium]
LSADELEYLSSSGIAALVRFARRVDERRGAAVVSGAGPEVKLLLQFFQLDKLLPMYRTRDEARAALSDRIPGGPAFQVSLEGPTEPLRGPDHIPEQQWPDPKGAGPVQSGVHAPAAPAQAHPTPAGLSAGAHPPAVGEPKQAPQTIGPKPIFAGDADKNRGMESRRGAGPDNAARSVKVVSMKAGTPAQGAQGSSPQASATSSFEEERLLFAEPIIFSCEQCGAHIRVYHSGRHMCPSCKVVFRVRRDGSASFVEKL